MLPNIGEIKDYQTTCIFVDLPGRWIRSGKCLFS